ncbi:MAG: MFS transporter [Solirubrobacteraceae bacterium]
MNERRIILLVSTLLGFESMMYSALTPLLPHYEHALHVAKPAVGLLTAAYPAGIIPGSLIGAWVAARLGVRRATLIGLAMFAVAIAPFGFVDQIVALDLLRVAQGVGCGLIWVGGLTWVIAAAPRERRGAMLGSVFAAAILGTLLGPILGIVAVAAGTAPPFAFVGVLALALAVWTHAHEQPAAGEAGERERRPALRALAANRPMLLGFWLIALEAGTIGATSTLLPLRLAHFGASGIVIGATFAIASLVAMQMTRPIGVLVDRRGPRPPLYFGLSLTALLMVALTLPTSVLGLAIVTVIALGGPLSAYAIPAMTMITDASERSAVPLVVASMLLNLAWASGEMTGAPVAASLAQVTSDAVPLLALAVLMAATLVPVRRMRIAGSGADAAAPGPTRNEDIPVASAPPAALAGRR